MSSLSKRRVLVIGAGVGGLAAAASLAKAGLEVTVLEAAVYPGGCAGTFYHQGYRFDAGATLAGGFYPGGPMDLLAQAAGVQDWRAQNEKLAMVVHLPEDCAVPLLAGEERWAARHSAFGERGLDFFRWQEHTADALWELALRLPAWPPQTPAELVSLASTGLRWLGDDLRRINPDLLRDAFQPAAAHLKEAPERLRLFADAQLLISAQATSATANALYAASALDLPRRGVVHLQGGMGGIAERLVEAIHSHGGQVLLRHEVTAITRQQGQPARIKTKRGAEFEAEVVIANLTEWNLRDLLAAPLAELEPPHDPLPRRLEKLGELPADAWGAFMLYLGIDGRDLGEHFPLHHQVITGEPLGAPLGEGNSVFLSLSPAWDAQRAPAGMRALTLSTHTDLHPWWQLQAHDPEAYAARKEIYQDKILAAAERALPGLSGRVRLALPATPVTFERFTRRHMGWVGGFPQTSLLRGRGPRIARNLWLVGDSIFPGQSTAAVALGGLRVSRAILNERSSS